MAVRTRRGDAACRAFLALLVALVFLPGFNGLLSLNDDWRRLAALHEAARRSVLRGGFPFRSPYFGGGYPTIAEPEDPTLSPFFLLALPPWGAATGLKLRALACALLAALGLFEFARRRLGLGRPGALAAGALLAAASWLPARQLSGNVTEMQAALAPWLLLLLLRRDAGRGRLAAAAALLALPAIDGKFVWPCLALYAFLTALAWGAAAGGPQRSAWRPAGRVLLAAALSAGLAAARLVPLAGLMVERGSLTRPALYPHKPGYSPASIGGYTLASFAHSLVDTQFAPGANRANRLTVGAAAAAVAALGLLTAGRRLWWFAAPGLVCFWLMCSHHLRPDLFRLLHAVPPFTMMTFPNKYFDFFVLMTFAGFFGAGVDWLRGRRAPRLAAAAAAAALLAGVAPPAAASWRIVAGTFTDSPALAREPAWFFQVRSRSQRPDRLRVDAADTYLNLLANVGTIDWFTPAPLPAAAQPRFFVETDGSDTPNPRYRGEAFADPPSNRARLLAFEPNRIIVEADMKTPGVVVVNQNDSRWWRLRNAQAAERTDFQGLLAARVLAPGRRVIEWRYFPWDFAAGAAASLLTAAALAAWALAGRRGGHSAR